MDTPDDIYREITAIARQPVDLDSPTYWHERAMQEEREAALWDEIARRAGEDDATPPWAVRAAARAADECRSKASECRRQDVREAT